MAYVGRRVEVYWPPDEDLAEGTWYRGIVDRYEQLNDDGGRGGYHVAYDDGDEEMLGEIDCRNDVRLLDSPRGGDGVTCLEIDNPESNDGDSAPRSEASAGHNHPEEIPTAGTSSGEENDIENHGSFPLDPSAERFIDVSRGEHQASSREASETGESYSKGRCNRHCGPGAAARNALESRNSALSEATTRRDETEQSSSPSGDVDGARLSDRNRETSESFPTAEIEAINEGMVTGNYSRIAPMSHEEQYQCPGDTAVAAPESGFSGDSDDDSTRLFRMHSGGEGGSYGNSSRSNRSEGTGVFSLSTDSSDWTPLRGSEFLSQSPARIRDDWSSSSATKEMPARDRKAVTTGLASALRDALDASAGVDVKGKPRGYMNTSPAMIGGRNGRRSGGVRSGDGCCEYQDKATADMAGRRDESVEMEALGDLIRHSATVSGAIEGVEGWFSGGVFVKVSFLDSGREPPTTDAMFRCKTLVHTTGSTAAGVSCGENSWPKGEFQFQVSHGGRVIELANAAVLFSVHRRIDGSGNDNFKRNDSFLGQILLPLRGALDNLRLLAFEDEYRAAPQDGSMGNQTVDFLAALVQHDGTIPGEGERNGSQKCVKHWRSLQGDVSGVYPVADRRGRVSHTERERVSIRLRLSVLLPLKKPASLMDLATQARAASGRPTVGVSLGRGDCGSFGACQGRDERALRHRTSTHGSSAGNATRGKGGHSSPRKLRAKIDCRYCHPPAVVPRRESQWIKRQREISRENERMERRLKAIREVAPRHNAALDKTVAAKAQERRNHRQRRGRDEGQTTAPRGMGNSDPTREGLPESAEGMRCDRGLHVFYGVPGKEATAEPVNGKAKKEEEVRRGALYKRRKALALATEKAATEAAEVRARVYGLRIKTSWTEINAKRAALAVASLQKALARRRRQSLARGRGGTEKLGQRGERGSDEKGGEADERVVAVPGRFTSGVVGPDVDVADEELADELRRQEELHKALLANRQKAVARTERSRQAREIDLKALKDVRAQLAQAEARQARYMWRRRETSWVPSNPSATFVSTTETLPKDAFEEAQDLVLLLRTEVETLRLAEAMEGGLAKPSPVNGNGDSEPQSRAAREALEEVTSLNSRLEDKKRRLEAISFRRDAIRTEYQDLASKGRRFELKESLGWLEHASLLLSKDSHLK